MDYFDQIVLTKDERTALKKIHRDQVSFRVYDPYDALWKHRLIAGKRSNSDANVIAVRITDTGLRYLLYLKGKQAAKRNEWIRYGITTAIALAAFVKSFFF